MNTFELNIQTPMVLAMTGKFQAPSPDWIHMSRTLLDYELIVMTEGELHIGCDQTRFTVKKGEYLLLPPFVQQYGYKISSCSFYWVHFLTSNPLTVLDANEAAVNSKEGHIAIPQFGTLKNIEKFVVLMKQLQDCVRVYHDKNLNDYMTTTILLELYNQICSHERNPEQNTKQQQIFNDLIDYIKWNCQSSLKVSQIADHFGYNEKYLSHLFTTVS